MGSAPRDEGPVHVAVCAHKLYAPPAPARAIPRRALLDRLLGPGRPSIALLQGPAGHGKTTLLQQLRAACEAEGRVTGWLTLDEADNDPRRFFPHMAQLIRSVTGTSPASRPGPRWQRQSDQMIDALMALEGAPALFIDEFQTLGSRALQQFFRELMERIPPNVHLFIGSRSVPEVGLSRLVVSRRAQVLHADDLRFSSDEVRAFFGQGIGPQINEAELTTIMSRTEGWPAALELFRLSLDSPQVRSDLTDIAEYRPRDLAEYLTDNVLGLQTPELQDFLLRTSVLPQFSAELCEAVTGRDDARTMLDTVARSGLFLRNLDGSGQWFKYHGLFASFLAEQFERRQSPAAVRDIHRRAACWLQDHERLDDALHHALAAGDVEHAADLLEGWSAQLIADAQLITMERWLERLPFAQIEARPALMVKAAYALTFLHRRHRLPPYIEALERFHREGRIDAAVVLSMIAISLDEQSEAFERVARIDFDRQAVEGFAAFELGAAGNLAAYRHLALGAFETAHEQLAQARMFSQRGAAAFSGGYNLGVSAMAHLVQGSLRQALDLLQRAQAEAWLHVDSSQASAALVACQLVVLYEANELQQAEELYEQHRETIVESTLPDFVLIAQVTAVRLHDARGRHDKAAQVLDETEAMVRDSGWPRLANLVGWERVRRALVVGQLEHARLLADRLGPADRSAAAPISLSEDIGDAQLCVIRLALANGMLSEAEAAIEEALPVQPGRLYRQLHLHLLAALLYRRRDARVAAQRSLEAALRIGMNGGYVRCFLDEGPGVVDLLRQCCQSLMGRAEADAQAMRQYVERLLEASGTDLGSRRRAAAEAPLEPLTDRETEMLVRLANGASNKVMARESFVSENTIKFHLKNIYAKLGVTSRLQAIAAARNQGLID